MHIDDGTVFQSRGRLNQDLLSGVYDDQLHDENDWNSMHRQPLSLNANFAGFNIFLFKTKCSENRCYFISNRAHYELNTLIGDTVDEQLEHNEAHFCLLKDGVHIVSNGELNDDSRWTRVRMLRQRLCKWIEHLSDTESIAETEQHRESKAVELLNDLINLFDGETNRKKKKQIKMSPNRILEELSEIMSDDTRFDEKEIISLDQCAFSYLTPERERQCHSQMLFKPGDLAEDRNDATVTQSIGLLEAFELKEQKNWKYHLFQRNTLQDDASSAEWQSTTI